MEGLPLPAKQHQQYSSCMLCAADAGSADSPPQAARVGAKGGQFGAFFAQVKDAASKVQTFARLAAVTLMLHHTCST